MPYPSPTPSTSARSVSASSRSTAVSQLPGAPRPGTAPRTRLGRSFSLLWQALRTRLATPAPPRAPVLAADQSRCATLDALSRNGNGCTQEELAQELLHLTRRGIPFNDVDLRTEIIQRLTSGDCHPRFVRAALSVLLIVHSGSGTQGLRFRAAFIGALLVGDKSDSTVPPVPAERLSTLNALLASELLAHLAELEPALQAKDFLTPPAQAAT